MQLFLKTSSFLEAVWYMSATQIEQGPV